MSADTWIQPFLTALASGCTTSEAAKAAGVATPTVYARRNRDADFAEAWASAMEDSTDVLEAEARRRAIDGVAEPVVYQGKVTYEQVAVPNGDGTYTLQDRLDANGQPVPLVVRRPSDALLALLLKGRRREFSTERTELTGAGGAPVAIDATTRAARVAALMQAAKQRSELA